MSDLIDRQAARDVVYKAFADMHTSSRDRLAEIDYGLLDLQSAQAEPKWIPVTERLPDKYGWYLCTLKDGRVDCYYWNRKGEWVDNGKKHFFELYNISSRYTGAEIKPEQEGSVYWTDWVIAWMPLPEPYREEGEQDANVNT